MDLDVIWDCDVDFDVIWDCNVDLDVIWDCVGNAIINNNARIQISTLKMARIILRH